MVAIGEVELYKKGEAIFRQGIKADNEESFFIVQEGKLLLRLNNKRTKEYTQGELFGEVAFLGEARQSGTVRAIEDSVLIVFDKNELLYSDKLSKELALKMVLLLAKKIVSYFEQEMRSDVKSIISKGETDYIEFKSSIFRKQKVAIVKTLVAFMNLNGGTILCGVGDDNGEILA